MATLNGGGACAVVQCEGVSTTATLDGDRGQSIAAIGEDVSAVAQLHGGGAEGAAQCQGVSGRAETEGGGAQVGSGDNVVSAFKCVGRNCGQSVDQSYGVGTAGTDQGGRSACGGRSESQGLCKEEDFISHPTGLRSLAPVGKASIGTRF